MNRYQNLNGRSEWCTRKGIDVHNYASQRSDRGKQVRFNTDHNIHWNTVTVPLLTGKDADKLYLGALANVFTTDEKELNSVKDRIESGDRDVGKNASSSEHVTSDEDDARYSQTRDTMLLEINLRSDDRSPPTLEDYDGFGGNRYCGLKWLVQKLLKSILSFYCNPSRFLYHVFTYRPWSPLDL